MIPMIANTTGCMSAPAATGINTVPKIMIVGIASMNRPNNKNNNAIINPAPTLITYFTVVVHRSYQFLCLIFFSHSKTNRICWRNIH